MNKCFHCGKSILFGRSHTHHRGVAGGRWKKRAPKTNRIFRANLQHVDIIVAGKVKRVKLCMKCLKRVKKDIKDGVKPFLALASLQKTKKKEKTESKPQIKKSVKSKKTSKK